MTERRLMQVRLSDEAREGWEQVAAREGATLTALLEALGLALRQRDGIIPRAVVNAARKLDRDRRSRR